MISATNISYYSSNIVFQLTESQRILGILLKSQPNVMEKRCLTSSSHALKVRYNEQCIGVSLLFHTKDLV